MYYNRNLKLLRQNNIDAMDSQRHLSFAFFTLCSQLQIFSAYMIFLLIFTKLHNLVKIGTNECHFIVAEVGRGTEGECLAGVSPALPYFGRRMVPFRSVNLLYWNRLDCGRCKIWAVTPKNRLLHPTTDVKKINDWTTFDEDDIQKLTFIGSDLWIRFESRNDKSWCDIKCTYYDFENYIEVNQCRLSVQSDPKSSSPNRNYSVGYTFSFQKDTKCEILYHVIKFQIDGDSDKYLQFDIGHISIDFQGHSKTCILNDERVKMEADFRKVKFVHPCKPGCGKYSNRIITSDPNDYSNRIEPSGPPDDSRVIKITDRQDYSNIITTADPPNHSQKIEIADRGLLKKMIPVLGCLPPFVNGNFEEWNKKFELFAGANDCTSPEKKAKILPLYLDGDTLSVFTYRPKSIVSFEASALDIEIVRKEQNNIHESTLHIETTTVEDPTYHLLIYNPTTDPFCLNPFISRVQRFCHSIPLVKDEMWKIPPRQIPLQYRDQIINQMITLIDNGIIRQSSSPHGIGLYEFTVKKSGLCGAPGTFQRMMNILSECQEDHLHHLRVVVKILSERVLSVDLEKSRFLMTEVPYLGFIFDKSGVKPVVRKPKNVKEMQKFLGMDSYYRRHIKDFATLSKPLYKLTQSDEFVWHTIHRFIKKISRQNPPQIGDFVFRQIPTHSKIGKTGRGEIKTVNIDKVCRYFKGNRDKSKVNSTWKFYTFIPCVRAIEAPLYQHGRPMRSRELPEQTHLVSRNVNLEWRGHVGYRRNPTNTLM
ncbi:hypothetical protein RF11_09175 [Thelohanellus kitauei]|uniref:Reverse transcriptase domain-containing protein n=1 Tax=Thelohanellus kitauei TaxID=669202 RepID=A0A0C2N4B5_THEKT|nr:hypothetical protein RF11_09175 [Thelohanellus kitauei]